MTPYIERHRTTFGNQGLRAQLYLTEYDFAFNIEITPNGLEVISATRAGGIFDSIVVSKNNKDYRVEFIYNPERDSIKWCDCANWNGNSTIKTRLKNIMIPVIKHWIQKHGSAYKWTRASAIENEIRLHQQDIIDNKRDITAHKRIINKLKKSF